MNSSPGCGGGLHKTARQRQAETGIWMTASLRDREGRLIHLQLQPLGAGQRRWREALPEDWARTLVRGPAGLCLLGTGLVLKLKALPSGNSPRVAGHPAGQSGARTGIQGP